MCGDRVDMQFGGTPSLRALRLKCVRCQCTSCIVLCGVRRAALALGCSLFCCVMTKFQTPKFNDVHKCESQ